MTYPERFILTSDYGALKNDSGSTTLSVSIPNGFVFNPSSPLIGFDEAQVGTINAPIRARGYNNIDDAWTTATFIYVNYRYTVAGFPGTQNGLLYCSLFRPNASTIRLEVNAEGVIGSPNYTVVGAVNVTYVITTFLSPLD